MPPTIRPGTEQQRGTIGFHYYPVPVSLVPVWSLLKSPKDE